MIEYGRFCAVNAIVIVIVVAVDAIVHISVSLTAVLRVSFAKTVFPIHPFDEPIALLFVKSLVSQPSGGFVMSHCSAKIRARFPAYDSPFFPFSY